MRTKGGLEVGIVSPTGPSMSGLKISRGQHRSSCIKKENKIFFIYKVIQNGAVAKSYMANGLLIHGEICAQFLIY